MKKTIRECEICGKTALDENQLRKENWIVLHPDDEINIWLEKPRYHKKGVSDSFMHSVGWQDREYDFCSIECLVKALNGKKSI